ncbi:hypothetical protein BDV96DRAFT_41353 [Lophiotrema nucula]|uniref:Uncharacterized protein n=1 Tax=Lophiotrema nucula TaxID=690887 RepID=A0A6A5ZCE7_9PLEO|nr:hypothetical protein BDV96DRAFT_41353 [Lophiotrema nucula]
MIAVVVLDTGLFTPWTNAANKTEYPTSEPSGYWEPKRWAMVGHDDGHVLLQRETSSWRCLEMYVSGSSARQQCMRAKIEITRGWLARAIAHRGMGSVIFMPSLSESTRGRQCSLLHARVRRSSQRGERRIRMVEEAREQGADGLSETFSNRASATLHSPRTPAKANRGSRRLQRETLRSSHV